MADDEDDASKTEDPSQRKLDKAKEEGNVAISQEIKSFFMLLGALVVIWLVSPLMMKWTAYFARTFISEVGQIRLDESQLAQLFLSMVLNILKVMAIPFAILIILGIAGTVSQIGFVLAPKRMEIKWEKINFFANLKEFITVKKIVESLKGIVKVAAVMTMCVLVMSPSLHKIPLLPSMESAAILAFMHKILVLILFTVVIAMLIIAFGDYAFQKFQHLKKMRMTKQEVKDEYKQSEGDPLIKSKIKSVRMERFRQRMMENVPKASVVITNPTHYAVALDYDLDTMAAPIVVAKGVDFLALRIRELADNNEVPIVENPPLARALFASVEVDQEIPPEHFKAVAEVIGYVMRLKEKLTR